MLKQAVGQADICLITLDTLRFDVAQRALAQGQLETLEPYLEPHGWEQRHSPATFTYAAHHAFLAGFLPTPPGPGPHPRSFAAQFGGSLSTTPETFTFSQATLPEALAEEGYRTICIGGTGFFNLQNELSQVLPNLFQERYWNPQLGVAHPNSEVHQVDLAIQLLAQNPQLTFLFINISALHQPNWFYAYEQPQEDDILSHQAALVAVDKALANLFQALKSRRPCYLILCSDHGSAYGEDGYRGHRCAHPVVWNVPYKEFWL
jgi:hypothetical protein